MIERTGSLRAARFFLVPAVLAGAIAARAQPGQPEGPSGFVARPAVAGSGFMAATANAYATDAAVEILRLGGNALDAAIAAQWVLNLVEPQSSGIGGGGFLLHWDQARHRVSAWDGRETAPRGVSADFARHPDGSPASFNELLATGKAVGVPGLVAMLEAAHRRHGKLRWERLARPAIRLAENGFAISPRLHALLRDDPLLRRDAAAHALYFRENGDARAIGEILHNPEFAASLRGIATRGADYLHRGALAEQIATAARRQGGSLTAADMRDYRARLRVAVCGRYRGWRICGMPPPSSGAVGVLQLLGMLELSGPPASDPANPDAAHRFAEAGRLAYADRRRYLADPDFVAVPLRALLDPMYLTQRSRLIDPARSMGIAAPGELAPRQVHGDDAAAEFPATNHLSIVDRAGNAVALTSSIESAFGSRIQVGGFLLNNQLTDFSLVAERDGKPVANRAEPGKRPMSSMAPTMVFDAAGRLHAVLGSPGGSRIINYVARTLVALLDAGQEPAAALALPHVGNRNGATEIERGRVPDALAAELEKRGHTLQRADMTSGLHLIVHRSGVWLGAADPRREGVARGD
jgi:gamma-glutamyltranspeptidase/glutathione hydrolase